MNAKTEMHIRSRVPRVRGDGFYARRMPAPTTLCGADPTTIDLSFRDATKTSDRTWVEQHACRACQAALAANPTCRA